MRPRRHVAVAALLATALLLPAGPSSVEALTLQRVWTARLGSGGSAGGITIRAYLNLTGSIRYSLRGLRRNAAYSVQVRNGTCTDLLSTALPLPSIRTSSSGTVSRSGSLTPIQMYNLWRAARRSAFSIRIVSGTSIRCGNFTFAHATRITLPGVGIDLPVIRGPSGYPPCRVAMYLAAVAQPGEPGITYIYAHARRGMFLPLLTRWRMDRGRSLIGKVVRVYTSDSKVSSYRIVVARVTSNPLAGVTSISRERLWLQTSTGPNSSYPLLIVEAVRSSTTRTTYAASHPTPHPVSC
jgi:hypothetical protein